MTKPFSIKNILCCLKTESKKTDEDNKGNKDRKTLRPSQLQANADKAAERKQAWVPPLGVSVKPRYAVSAQAEEKSKVQTQGSQKKKDELLQKLQEMENLNNAFEWFDELQPDDLQVNNNRMN